MNWVALLLFCFLNGAAWFFFILTRWGRRKKAREILTRFLEGHRNERIHTEASPSGRHIDLLINKLLEEYQSLEIKASELENNRRVWLTNISHDIRTPLTAIIGYLEALDPLLGADHKAREYMDILLAKSLFLKKRIDALFLLARQASGDFQLTPVEFDLAEFLRLKLIEFMPLLEKLDFTLQVDIPSGTCVVEADPSGLDRVVSNLIRNVLDHAAEGKYLGVSLVPGPQVYSLTIRDKGPGIPSQARSWIFERLSQSARPAPLKPGRTGLGLNICKVMMEAHGGNITCSPWKQGTAFSLTLPVKVRKM